MLASIKTERAERDVSLALARADVPADRLASRIAAGKRRDGRLYRAVAYYFLRIERYDLAADAISMIVANIGQARNDIGLLAYVAATHGDRARAASLAQSRLVEEPRDDWALLARALVLAKAGKLEGALRDGSNAASDAPDSTEAVRVLASIYRLRGEQQLAEKAVVAAFNANRDSEFLLRLLARQMSENGRIHALTEILRSFVLRNPESVMGWRLRAHFCRIALQPACATRADAIVKALRGEAVALPATPADERRIHYMGR